MARFEHRPIHVDAYKDGDHWIVTGPGGHTWTVDDARFRAHYGPLEHEARLALRGQGPAAETPRGPEGPPTMPERPRSKPPASTGDAPERTSPFGAEDTGAGDEDG